MTRNKSFFYGLFLFSILCAFPVLAQGLDLEFRKIESGEADTPDIDPPAEMINHPVVKLQSLDKITARTETFEANVGSTVKFGSLYIKVQACRKTSPIEQPESAAFLQVWEVDTNDEAAWIFSGWMFASSPGLSSMDHPIYDVWVLDCLEKKGVQEEDIQAEKERGEGELEAEEVPDQPDVQPAEE